MHARSRAVRAPPMPAENGKRAFRGVMVEVEALLGAAKGQSRARTDGPGPLTPLCEQAKTPRRYLSPEEECAVFKRYNAAWQALDKLKAELGGLKNGSSRTPRARQIKREIRRNEDVMRSAETILVAEQAGWIHMLAKRRMRLCPLRHLDEEDLAQEAKYTLIRDAIPKFDHEMGCRFRTYATYWIRLSMDRAIDNFDSEVRMPVYQHTQAKRLNRLQKDCLTKEGREPTEREMHDEVGIRSAELIVPKTLSIHRKHKGERGKGQDLLAVLPDVNADDPEQTAIRNDKRTAARKMLGILNRRDLYVLTKRFGLDNKREHLLEEVGAKLGVTTERARQIEDKAIEKLRRRFKSKRSEF